MSKKITADFGLGPEPCEVVQTLNMTVESSDPLGFALMSGIWFDHALWLVLGWKKSADGQWRRPTKALCLEGLEVSSGTSQPTLLHLWTAIHKATLDDLAPPPLGMKVRSMPPVVALNAVGSGLPPPAFRSRIASSVPRTQGTRPN